MIAVTRQKYDGPSDLILDALASRIARIPQLKILKPVIGPLPVFVVDGLGGKQCPTESLLHYEAMFKDLPTTDMETPVAIIKMAALELSATDGAVDIFRESGHAAAIHHDSSLLFSDSASRACVGGRYTPELPELTPTTAGTAHITNLRCYDC